MLETVSDGGSLPVQCQQLLGSFDKISLHLGLVDWLVFLLLQRFRVMHDFICLVS